MFTPTPLESRWQEFGSTTLVPADTRLPAAVAAERRDVAARRALLWRIHREFEEMPGLSLTIDQAARLFGLRVDIASRILEGLTVARVLRRRGDGRFARLEESA